jgi:hypothetical protein
MMKHMTHPAVAMHCVSAISSAVAKSKETKEVELVTGDKTKMARIGAALEPK